MTIPLPPAPKPRTSAPSARWLGLGSLLSLAAAVVWLLWASVGPVAQPPNSPRLVTALESGVVAAMDSPLFRYSPGWRTSALGADPSEPANPWDEPAGEVAFSYTGKALALQLAVGDYWGYLFVTVDGAPANRLAVIPGNQDSRGEEAGYKPFLAPERQSADGAALVWLPVHQADDDGPHAVRLEVWRSWGQFPLRGVAIDALPVPRPRWPAGLLGLLGLAAIIFGFQNRTRIQRIGRMAADDSPGISFPVVRLFRPTRVLFQSSGVTLWLLRLWPGALLLVGGGVALESWLLTDVGLGLLALAGLRRAEVWVAALLFGLPFYLHPLPILPGRSLNLIEIGVWGGLLLVGLGRLGTGNGEAGNGAKPNTDYALRTTHYVFLLLLWSLLSALAAEYTPLALREWRTLFLAAGGFALLLAGVFAQTDDPARTRRLLFSVWLAGGTAVALIALWQFAFDQMLIQAEGVLRVRGLYGSPNNLALYLERTVAVGVGYWVLRIAYVANPRAHFVRNTQYVILLLPQLAALVLTFSKGALFLGLPALLL
ncbi:MAG TPA: hypothetical protein PL105_19590, partial [Caldilineaceae bacterium]|nr:hypothetical protein [Caldilineaceae bacterium]